MLSFLRIRNLAVIESVDVEFASGFNVLTGETGAGKSILVEAVGLLLGGRSSAELVRTGEPLASIEAIFDDDGQELIVRREISAQGRSRAFINGALATAGALRDLSNRLVELHGQHEHQALLDPLGHLPVLDDYAGHQTLLAEVSAAWTAVALLREQLDRVGMEKGEREARLELVRFQLSEIEKAAVRPGEDEELATLKQVLSSAERVQRLCDESHSALYESDNVRKRLSELSTIDGAFEPYVASLEGVKSQLEDIAWFVRDYGARVESSPERLQQVEDRLALLERLKRKYGPTLTDVVERAERLTRERELLDTSGQHIDDIRARLEEATRAYATPARRLSESRRKAATRFAADLERMLADLAMARTRFDVRFNAQPLAAEAWSATGIDRAEFFISPNPGEEPRPLARIASGGELSRIMLALKTLSAQSSRRVIGAAGPNEPIAPAGSARPPRGSKTLIFDEVDAGIGGQVADVVGRHLQALGNDFQVLCITHLPQIAARGATHFRITKRVKGERTSTSVDRLSAEGREDEVARMIGGASTTAAVKTSAREMLYASRPSPTGGKGESESPPRGESESRRGRR
jgi:DNA repair protein RecN (Recombination protein N)